jgi:hypothetical protein
VYCGDPVCIHPFTGEKIRILDTTPAGEKREAVTTKTKKRVSLDDIEGLL